MAKVIYFESPVSNTKVREFEIDKDTLVEVLREIGIHNHPSLAVRINGRSYEELSMLHPIDENDIIEIKHMVHGSGSEGNKNALATVVQIAALVASFIIPGGQAIYAVAKAAILVAGAVIAGAIRRAGIQNTVADRDASTETAADAFSLTAAQNELRALEPMPVILGSHRIAPDFGSKPYSFYSGGGTPSVETRWADGVIDMNENFPTTLPAGWLSSNVFNQFTYDGVTNPTTKNLWPYQVRVMSGWDPVKFISDAKLEDIIGGTNTFEDYMHFSSFQDYTYDSSSGAIQGRGPIIIEHFDPADPIVIANGGNPFRSTLQMICWTYFSQFKFNYNPIGGAENFAALSHGNTSNYFENNFERIYRYLCGFQSTLGLSSDPAAADSALFAGSQTMRSLYRKKDRLSVDDIPFFNQMTEATQFDITSGGDDYDPNMDLVFPGFVVSGGGDASFAARKQIIDQFFDQLNAATTISVPGRFLRSFDVPEVPKTQEVRHIMHYGLGDLEVLDRRVGSTEIDKISGQETYLADKSVAAWAIPQNLYASNVKSADGADLINNAEFEGPETLETLDPSVLSNWITRETPDNCTQIYINIEGRSFESNDDGTFSLFGADFEIQLRKKTDALFTLYDGSYFLASNKPEAIRETVIIDLSSDPDKYEIRIRKRTPDPITTEFVQDFSITNFYFFIEDNNSYVAENREGLRLEATGSFNGTTNSYNSLVESKCWVYNGSTWNWEHTRNPAWWFLYYARGGFTNETANGSLVYPFSPTIGWVNSADHPDNIERMFGAGLKDEEIDIEKIIEWGSFCDDNNLSIDLVIREDNHVHEFLNRIADVGRASSSFYRGKLSVVIEDPNQIPVAMYGMGNIIKDTFTVTYVTEDLPDKIIANFSDRNDEWRTRQVEADVPNTTETVTRVELSFPGVTEEAQAQREVNLLAARQLYQRRQYSWKTDTEGLLVRRGDLVYLSHDITQYDQSGRCVRFEIENGLVTKIETPIVLEPMTHVMVRTPFGEILTFEATNQGKTIVLQEDYTANKGPNKFNPDTQEQNQLSIWPNSYADDFIFFAGPKETPGKIVRISEIHAERDLTFTIDAVEEEAAMYSYEFTGVPVSSEDLSSIVSKVIRADYKDLGEGRIELFWTLDAAYAVQIFNSRFPAIPLQVQGGSTIAGNSAILELNPDDSYDLIIEPVTVGVPFKKESFTLNVRT